MPFYDRLCRGCGWIAVDVLEPVHVVNAPLCPACGDPTERAWLTKPSNVIGDEMDLWVTNGTRVPFHCGSKLEHKRWLKEHGYTIRDEHIGMPGSDKAPTTTRWVTGGSQWLKDAEILATRNGAGSKDADPPLDMHIRTYTGDAQIGSDGSITLREHA